MLFARQGPLAGHIKVTDGGKTVLDRDLAARVEDNFKGWKDDPRHKEWVTNPHMRAVIGEAE